MPWACEHVTFETLKPAANAQQYALHMAALEWSLAEPIVISNKDDIKSKSKWRDGFAPYHHQVQNLITFCRRLPVTLLADDVGLGKTISAGLVLGELIERKRVRRALVVCPAILGHQWVEELSGKFGINGIFVTGRELTQCLKHTDVPVVVTTYASARMHIATVRREQFDMLILDEAHKMRNLHGTDKPPLMAKQVRQALESRIFKFVLMLTATPIQNRVWDLYSLIDLLTVARGHRNPMGNPGEFRVRFVDDAAGRRLRPRSADEFRSILRQYIVRTRREDAKLKFPERMVETRKLRGGEVEAKMFQIVRAQIDDLSPLVQISISQAMMSSPQALAMQLRNMAENKTVSSAVAEEMTRFAAKNLMTAKLNGLLTLVRELREQRPVDWRVVIFTLRKETQEAIGRALVSEGIKVGFIRGGAAHANQHTVERFRTEPPQVSVIVSTDAGAEGVNLQSGNVLVNFDLPWNPMVLEQRIGRIQRLASRHEHVVVVNLVIADSVEERVVGRLLEKLTAVSETIGDIETILESAGQDDDDSFEEMVRKLVISSLKGQDVDEATRAATVSIDRAKELMTRERGVIDRVFGSAAQDVETGPTPPEISAIKPSMEVEPFVLAALAAEGAAVRPASDNTHEAIRPGKPIERITFNLDIDDDNETAVPAGDRPNVYLPGRPEFETLVQRWVERAGHCMRDLSANLESQNHAACKKWCATVSGAVFHSCEIIHTQPHVAGSAICRAKAANGVDALEKLVHVHLNVAGHDAIPPAIAEAAPVLPEHLTADVHFEGLSEIVIASVEDDSDITAFCKFYEGRKRDELYRAGSDERRRHKVETDLTPKVGADVVAVSGVRYHSVRSKVIFYVDRQERHEVELELVPATGQVLESPELSESLL
jgi:superfamily II DNA or RNA helicase